MFTPRLHTKMKKLFEPRNQNVARIHQDRNPITGVISETYENNPPPANRNFSANLDDDSGRMLESRSRTLHSHGHRNSHLNPPIRKKGLFNKHTLARQKQVALPSVLATNNGALPPGTNRFPEPPMTRQGPRLIRHHNVGSDNAVVSKPRNNRTVATGKHLRKPTVKVQENQSKFQPKPIAGTALSGTSIQPKITSLSSQENIENDRADSNATTIVPAKRNRQVVSHSNRRSTVENQDTKGAAQVHKLPATRTTSRLFNKGVRHPTLHGAQQSTVKKAATRSTNWIPRVTPKLENMVGQVRVVASHIPTRKHKYTPSLRPRLMHSSGRVRASASQIPTRKHKWTPSLRPRLMHSSRRVRALSTQIPNRKRKWTPSLKPVLKNTTGQVRMLASQLPTQKRKWTPSQRQTFTSTTTQPNTNIIKQTRQLAANWTPSHRTVHENAAHRMETQRYQKRMSKGKWMPSKRQSGLGNELSTRTTHAPLQRRRTAQASQWNPSSKVVLTNEPHVEGSHVAQPSGRSSETTIPIKPTVELPTANASQSTAQPSRMGQMGVPVKSQFEPNNEYSNISGGLQEMVRSMVETSSTISAIERPEPLPAPM